MKSTPLRALMKAINRFRHLLYALVLCAGTAHAQVYPSKPVQVVVPFPPGGSSDVIARLINAKLTEAFKQNFITDNRPGAGTLIGTTYVAKAAPDGYTLLLADVPFTVNPTVILNANYDPVKDFTPITIIGASAQFLYANSARMKSLSELLAAAKAKAGSSHDGHGGKRNHHALDDGDASGRSRHQASAGSVQRFGAGAERRRGGTRRRGFLDAGVGSAAGRRRQAPGHRRHFAEAPARIPGRTDLRRSRNPGSRRSSIGGACWDRPACRRHRAAAAGRDRKSGHRARRARALQCVERRAAHGHARKRFATWSKAT